MVIERCLYAGTMNSGPCRLNTMQLPQYFSWHHDPFSMAVDTPQHTMEDLAFPPFSLVERSLHKVWEEKNTILLVAPVWPSQGWYPVILRLL